MARVLLALTLSLALATGTRIALGGRYPAPVHVLEILGPAEHVVVGRVVLVPTRHGSGQAVEPEPAARPGLILHLEVEQVWQGPWARASGGVANTPPPRLNLTVCVPEGTKTGAPGPPRRVGARVVAFLPSAVPAPEGAPRAAPRFVLEDGTALQHIEAHRRVRLGGIWGISGVAPDGTVSQEAFRTSLDRYLGVEYRAQMLADLRGEEVQRRRFAVRQLARLDVGEAVPDMLSTMERDPDDLGRAVAAWIGRMRDARIAPALVELLAGPRSRGPAVEALRTLEGVQRRRAIEPLLRARGHPQRDVRNMADGLLRHFSGKAPPYDLASWRAWWERARGQAAWQAGSSTER